MLAGTTIWTSAPACRRTVRVVNRMEERILHVCQQMSVGEKFVVHIYVQMIGGRHRKASGTRDRTLRQCTQRMVLQKSFIPSSKN